MPFTLTEHHHYKSSGKTLRILFPISFRILTYSTMQLLSLCLLAIAFAATAANVATPKIELTYVLPNNTDITMEVPYDECIAVVKPGDQHLIEVLFPSIESECMHFKDALCTQMTSAPFSEYPPGYSILNFDFESMKCRQKK